MTKLDNDEIQKQYQDLKLLIEGGDRYIREQVWILLAEHPLAFNLFTDCSMFAFRILPFENNCDGARLQLEICLSYAVNELRAVDDDSILDKARYLANALPLIRVEGGLFWALLVVERTKIVKSNPQLILEQVIELMNVFCDSLVHSPVYKESFHNAIRFRTKTKIPSS